MKERQEPEEETEREAEMGRTKADKVECITGNTVGKKEELGEEWEIETVERRVK